MNKRLTILVGAYACSPVRGSEQGVGWGWVECLSKYHDLWVLVGEQSRDEIEAELNRRPGLRKHLHFYYIPRLRFPFAEKLWPPLYLLTYRWQWQRQALRAAKELHSLFAFDLVHQLTYVGFRVPGYLWKLDVPFVWGPIGGLEQTTWRLLPALGIKGAAYFAARNLINDFHRKFLRLPRIAFEKAGCGTIAATTQIARDILRFYAVEASVIPEVGLPPVPTRSPRERLDGEPLKIVWCGRHVPGKALPFLLKALKLVGRAVSWELTIVGDGPYAQRWKKLAWRLGVTDRCVWVGNVERCRALQTMAGAHVLVITSVYDLTSTVLVEALAMGLPVICPDHCGFVDAITEDCGIKVPARTPDGFVAGLCSAIEAISDERKRINLANGAVQRSEGYGWGRKAQLLNDIYARRLSLKCGTRRSPLAN